MIKPNDDPESEIAPPVADPTTEQSSFEITPTAVPEQSRESVRRHAEEFVVEWMRGAVQKAKSSIVDKAMVSNSTLIDLAGLDKTIIGVISKWDFSVDP